MFTVMNSVGFAIRAGWRCAWTSTPAKESFPLFRWESWRLRDLCLLYSCGKRPACPALSGEHKTASHSLSHHTPVMSEIPFGRLNYEAFDAGPSSWFQVLRARANPCADLVKLTTEGILTKPLWPMSPPLWELGCGTEVNVREILVAPAPHGVRRGKQGHFPGTLSEPQGAGSHRRGSSWKRQPCDFQLHSEHRGWPHPPRHPPAPFGPPLMKGVSRHLTLSCLRADPVFSALGVEQPAQTLRRRGDHASY